MYLNCYWKVFVYHQDLKMLNLQQQQCGYQSDNKKRKICISNYIKNDYDNMICILYMYTLSFMRWVMSYVKNNYEKLDFII